MTVIGEIEEERALAATDRRHLAFDKREAAGFLTRFLGPSHGIGGLAPQAAPRAARLRLAMPRR